MEKEIENLKLTSGAKFFDKAQNDVFPEADFHFSVECDKFNFIVKLEKGEDGVYYMKKREV